MKTPSKILGLLVIGIVAFSSCTKFTQTQIYTANKPVYLSYDDLRTSVSNANDRSLLKPGKIFLYNQYILINDFETGVHIYNNADPASPKHVGFVNVPGNVDIAVNDNILYVDSYVDIVAIDISNPSDVKEVGRNADVLSYTIPGSMDYKYPVSNIDPSKGLVVGYEVGEVEESCKNNECGSMYYSEIEVNRGDWEGEMMSTEGSVVSFAGNSNNVRSLNNSNTSAIAGSMARFMLIGNYLYAIADQSTVKVFDISTSSMPLVTTFNPWSDASGNGNIETLFSFKDHLFIGSTAGMLAYDVSDPSNPNFVSNYTHMTGCDPVVANDDFAFVTIRSGTECGTENLNILDVLDISNIMSPYSIGQYNLSEPHGLALDNSNEILFVCDGTSGMQVYNTSDANDLKQLGSKSGDTYDVIAHRSIAHVIGDRGLVQYSYDPSGALQELSRIDLN